MRELSQFFPEGVPTYIASLAPVLWLFQLALIIHVYRTGRPYWWIWVLFAVPGIGGLAYVVVEILPDFRSSSTRGLGYSLKPRKWRIADLRGVLEESETINNRLDLAEELFAAGEISAAHEVAAECLNGFFKDDPRTMTDVAKYKLALKKFAEAYALLENVDTKRNIMLAIEREVLRGDCLLGLERYDEAESAYRGVAGRYIGEAPRMGLAAVYEQTGRLEDAIVLWKDIRTKFRRASPAWRRTERKWYKIATAKLKAQKG